MAAGVVAVLIAMLASAALAAAVITGAAVLVVARLTPRGPGVTRLAVPLALLTALTVAQPFGVRATPVPAASARGPVAEPDATRSAPPFRFRLHENPIRRLGLGECCPPQDTLRVRSWVLLPGLLTNGSDVTDLHGDGVPRSWSLQRAGGEWTIRADSPSPRPDLAWRLRPGVASASGVVFWLAVAGALAFLSPGGRRRAASS